MLLQMKHTRKCLMELGELEEAETCFIQYLKLREPKANPPLIKSTELTLILILTLKKNN